MRKKRIRKVLILVLAICAGAIGLVYAVGAVDPRVEAILMLRGLKRDAEGRKVLYLPDQEASFEYYYNKANDDQKERLDNIRPEYMGITLNYRYPKQVLIIMNKLPEDAPYITVDQALEKCRDIDPALFDNLDSLEWELIQRFNELAGAPDYYGGSGLTSAVYYVNSGHTEYIIVCGGAVRYVSEKGQGFDQVIFPVSMNN